MKLEPIRVEKLEYYFKCSKYKYYRYVGIFECLDCKKEIRLELKRLSLSTGKCKTCVNKGIPYKHIYNKLVWESKYGKRKLEIKLTFEEFLTFINKNCFYCDEKIPWQEHQFSQNGKRDTKSKGYYLDRKDSNKGYSINNCVACCKSCNWSKSNLYSFEEFILLTPILKQIKVNRKIK